MKRISFLLLLLALTLCACRAQESPAPLPDAPAASPSDQTPIPLTPDPTPDAPAEPTVDTLEDGVHLQDGTAYDYQNGAPVTGSGLTELDGAWYVFQPDGSLFPFVHGLNDCNGILYYHTGEDGFALNTPDAGLYDDGEALYFVQDDRSLLQNGSEGYSPSAQTAAIPAEARSWARASGSCFRTAPRTPARTARRGWRPCLTTSATISSIFPWRITTPARPTGHRKRQKPFCSSARATAIASPRRSCTARGGSAIRLMSSRGMNRARTTTMPGR